MAAWNHEHERSRLSEAGVTRERGLSSTQQQLWSLLAERTEDLNPFDLEVDLALHGQGEVTAEGFSHRGDLSNSYQRSVQAAENETIVRRYQLENQGYEKARELFFDLPLYSTILLLSPPADVPIKGYGRQSMACFYYILPGEGENKRIIKSLALTHYFSQEEQAAILNNFLIREKVVPREESILLSPICIYGFGKDDRESLRIIWQEMEGVYSQKPRDFWLPSFEIIEEFLLHGEEIREREHPALSQMISEIAVWYASGDFPADFASKWKIMLNLADKELLHRDVSEKKTVDGQMVSATSTQKLFYFNNSFYRSDFERGEIDGTIFSYYQELNYEPRVVATQCGPSGGIGEGRDGLFGSQEAVFTTNTFEAEREGGEICQVCRQSNKDSHYHCPSCERKYKDETNLSKEQRIKECSCGFKFGC